MVVLILEVESVDFQPGINPPRKHAAEL